MSEWPRGAFVLSFDLELIWGTLDLHGPEAFRSACQAERETVGRLVDLLAEYEIPATWFVVGHLFLDRCAPIDGRKHPEIVPPRHAWVRGDWFDRDPGGSEDTQPVFFGRSLVERIRGCPVRQEIGAHSFSHVIFGDRGCSRETANSELAACTAAAAGLGIELRSFAFPRNRPGHLDLLPNHGFRVFRGPGPQWYESGSRQAWSRLGHLVDVLLAVEPPTVLPRPTPEGLISVPGAMVYFPAHGLRRFIPTSRRVLRARKGLNAAARRRQVFHLWLHPTSLTDTRGEMWRGLTAILAHAVALRRQGRLDVVTVGEMGSRSRAAIG